MKSCFALVLPPATSDPGLFGPHLRYPIPIDFSPSSPICLMSRKLDMSQIKCSFPLIRNQHAALGPMASQGSPSRSVRTGSWHSLGSRQCPKPLWLAAGGLLPRFQHRVHEGGDEHSSHREMLEGQLSAIRNQYSDLDEVYPLGRVLPAHVSSPQGTSARTSLLLTQIDFSCHNRK